MSDWLGLDNWLYPKSFMSLLEIKDETYIAIDDSKVPNESSYILCIS